MYPFYVLDLPEDATDEQVESRYRELLVSFPPDVCGEAFQRIRAAYETLRTARSRVSQRLLFFDNSGRGLLHGPPPRLKPERRPRLPPGDLESLLRASVSLSLDGVEEAPENAGRLSRKGLAPGPGGKKRHG